MHTHGYADQFREEDKKKDRQWNIPGLCVLNRLSFFKGKLNEDITVVDQCVFVLVNYG